MNEEAAKNHMETIRYYLEKGFEEGAKEMRKFS